MKINDFPSLFLMLSILLGLGCSKNEFHSPKYVTISKDSPDPYRHPSTHPNSLSKKLRLDSSKGHGDGLMFVPFHGNVCEINASGDHVRISDVKFYRLNDSMLMGEKKRDELSFTSDQMGMFIGYINIFSASGYSKSKRERVVYQTGTAILSAEAEGYESLIFNVRREQPHTTLILERKLPNQQVDPIVKTPVDEVGALGTQGHP